MMKNWTGPPHLSTLKLSDTGLGEAFRTSLGGKITKYHHQNVTASRPQGLINRVVAGLVEGWGGGGMKMENKNDSQVYRNFFELYTIYFDQIFILF